MNPQKKPKLEQQLARPTNFSQQQLMPRYEIGQPSTSGKQWLDEQPCTPEQPEQQQPSTSREQRPPTSYSDQQPSTSGEQRPPTPYSDQQPSTSGQQPASFEPSTSDAEDEEVTPGSALNRSLYSEEVRVIYKDDWIFIYFSKNSETNYQCNICHSSVDTVEGLCNSVLVDHMVMNHKSIYDIHKDNSNENIGFRIEFLQLNVLKDGEESNKETMILSDMSMAEQEEFTTKQLAKADDGEGMQYILIADGETKKKKVTKHKDPSGDRSKKRSWVWNYFDRLSSIIYKCNICSVVLSIKGSNTNNMNRHMKSRHPALYIKEMARNPPKRTCSELTDVACEVEIANSSKNEDGAVSAIDTPRSGNRVSWVWNYFTRISKSQAQCKLCNRNITHGGNATGNMNRHLKALHKGFCNFELGQESKRKQDEGLPIANKIETVNETDWIWKLFTDDEEHFFECKMCGFKCMKFNNPNKSVAVILKHLKSQHEVISGDQIVTAAECSGMDESTIAVDFLKDTEEI